MSSAQEAYTEALRLIAKAKKSGSRTLSFATEACRALAVLPQEIADLDQLRTLRFDYTQVADLTPLMGMVGLEAVSLNNTQVVSLTALIGMVEIRSLSLNSTKVADLTPIAGMLAINTLHIENTSVTDLTPIADLVAMTNLSLMNTNVSNLSPLARLTGMLTLRLDSTQVTDLAPLVGISGITELFIANTKVKELTPIEGMVGMTWLSLRGCEVMDLRPILRMAKLTQHPRSGSLRFENTAATRVDARIAEIAEIEDSAARARTLFEYLQDWVPPGETLPEPDNLLPVSLTNGRLEIARSLPSEAEIDDRLKRALHERLLPKAVELAWVAGNTQGRLAGRARSLVDRLDRPFEELDMINIHMDVEDLSTSLRTNVDRVGEDRYSPDILDALTDVTSIGPGLTLDNVDVDKLEDRKRRFAADPAGPEVMAAHNEFSRAVAVDVAAMGDNLRALEARLVDREGEASSGALQVSVHRDILIKARRYSLTRTEAVLLGAAGSGLWQFVFENRDVIMVLANSYGAGFAHWFSGMIAQVSDFAGLAAHVEVKPILRKREPK
jgi:internalin A